MNIAIIDDLTTDIEKTSKLLQSYFLENCADIQPQISFFKDGEGFLADFKHHAYDIIFLDYYMAPLSGMDLAREIRKTDASVVLIFVTFSKDFAIESYKVKASGYLVKPIAYEDFAEIMGLIDMKKIRSQQFIEIGSGDDSRKIILKDIIYCDVYGHYTQVHTKSGGIKRFRTAFWKISELLQPYPQFLVCYRGCIINMERVVKMEEQNFLMANRERIPYRKKEHSEIINAYSNFLFERVRNETS